MKSKIASFAAFKAFMRAWRAGRRPIRARRPVLAARKVHFEVELVRRRSRA